MEDSIINKELKQGMELIRTLKYVKLTTSPEGKEEYQSVTPSKTAQMNDLKEQLDEISDLDKRILKNLNNIPDRKKK
jgi:hypothetical protein